jgi:hypothetical protein
MLNRLIQWSLTNRAVVVGASLVILVLGLRTGWRLPVEVLPDLTRPTVVILTEAPGLAPEEVEGRVTQPLESALMGVAGLGRVRSNSDVALSLVYAEFGWDTDIYRARVLVQERLQLAREQLPDGVQPFMTPVASLMGEILLVGVRSTRAPGDPDYLPPREVRTLADWVIRRRLQTIPGLAEILNMGGGVARIEIQPDPHRLQAHGVTLADLARAAAEAASTTTGGFLDAGPTEIMVRNIAMTTDLDALARTVVKKTGDRPVLIRDVAHVVWGTEPRRGDATVSIAPEKTPTYGVIMSVTKAPGFDTRDLTGADPAALEELARRLPPGVETTLLFQQKDFIDHAIGNLQEAIRDGAIMVSLVLLPVPAQSPHHRHHPDGDPDELRAHAAHLPCAWHLGELDDTRRPGRRHRHGGRRRHRGRGKRLPPPARERRLARPRPPLRGHRPRLRRGPQLHPLRHRLIVLVFLPLLGLSGVEGKLFAPIAIGDDPQHGRVVSRLPDAHPRPLLAAPPARTRTRPRRRPARPHAEGGAPAHGAPARPRPSRSPCSACWSWAPRARFLLYPRMSKDFLPPSGRRRRWWRSRRRPARR